MPYLLNPCDKFIYQLYQPKNIYNHYNHPENQAYKRSIYHRDRKNYYGPENTFEEIPKVEYKFKVIFSKFSYY